MEWVGGGVFRGTCPFYPKDGYNRYHYRVISDRPDIVYGWVRGQGSAAVQVLEAGYTGSVIFGIESSLSDKPLVPYLDVYNGAQWLKNE